MRAEGRAARLGSAAAPEPRHVTAAGTAPAPPRSRDSLVQVIPARRLRPGRVTWAPHARGEKRRGGARAQVRAETRPPGAASGSPSERPAGTWALLNLGPPFPDLGAPGGAGEGSAPSRDATAPPGPGVLPPRVPKAQPRAGSPDSARRACPDPLRARPSRACASRREKRGADLGPRPIKEAKVQLASGCHSAKGSSSLCPNTPPWNRAVGAPRG